LRTIRLPFALLLAALVFLGAGWESLAQPPIPKEKIPKEISGDVRELIEKLYSPDPWVRKAGASRLGKKGEQAASAVPFLIGTLSDNTIAGFTTPGKEAAEALVKIGDPAVEGLIGIFGDTGVPGGVRKTAASILWQIKDPQAVDPLILGLADRDAGVRTAAAALGGLKDARAVGPLVAALKDHPSPVVIDALVRIGDRKAADPIVPFATGNDPQVRIAALHALIRLKDPRAAEFAAAELRSPDANVRKGVLCALAAANYPGAVGYLLGALKDRDPKVRSAALYDLNGDRFMPEYRLKPSEDPRSFEALASVLKDEDKDVRKRAVEVLGRHYKANPRTVELLIPMLHDRDEIVRLWAASELERIDDYRVVESLIGATRDSLSDVWIAALQGLERITATSL